VVIFSGRSGDVLRIHFASDVLEEMGSSMCQLGDVDRDGTPDYAIGASGAMDYSSGLGVVTGVVSVYSGADGEVLAAQFGRREQKIGDGLALVEDTNLDGVRDLYTSGRFPPRGGVVLSGRDLVPLETVRDDARYSGCDLSRDGRVDAIAICAGDLVVRDSSGEGELLRLAIERKGPSCSMPLVAAIESFGAPPSLVVAMPGLSLSAYRGSRRLELFASIGAHGYGAAFEAMSVVPDVDGDRAEDICVLRADRKGSYVAVLSTQSLDEMYRIALPLDALGFRSQLLERGSGTSIRDLVIAAPLMGHQFAWLLFSKPGPEGDRKR
jgi:hypothetical protein